MVGYFYGKEIMTYQKGPTTLASPFGNAPLDASRRTLDYAKGVVTADASGTTSPVTGTTPVTLNIPTNAVDMILAHDSSSTVSTVSFNGTAGEFGLVANSVVTFDCTGENFNTVTITPGESTNVYFAFEEI